MEGSAHFIDEEDRDATVHFLYQNCHHALYLYATGLCKRFGIDISQADDLMQEFYLNVLRNHRPIIRGYFEKGIRYLYGVIKFDLFDFHRKQKSIRRIEEAYALGVRINFNIHYLTNDLFFEQFTDQLNLLLPEESCRLFKMYLQGYSYKEIQKRLKLNISTVGVKIHRIKKTLASHLDR